MMVECGDAVVDPSCTGRAEEYTSPCARAAAVISGLQQDRGESPGINLSSMPAVEQEKYISAEAEVRMPRQR